MLADWTDLKSVLTGRNIVAQYVTVGNNYWIKAIDGTFELECIIPTNISNPDTADFVNNFQAAANTLRHTNVVQVLGKDSLSLYPFGAIVNPAANTTTNCDIQIPFTTVVKGGVLFSQNATVGDYISALVVDKDNVLGMGGTSDNPTVLGQYVYKWYIMPGVPNTLEDISISQSLPQGLYFRFTYTSVSPSVAPSVLINFISYVTIG